MDACGRESDGCRGRVGVMRVGLRRRARERRLPRWRCCRNGRSSRPQRGQPLAVLAEPCVQQRSSLLPLLYLKQCLQARNARHNHESAQPADHVASQKLILHMGRQASKMGPRASKVTRNRASDLPRRRGLSVYRISVVITRVFKIPLTFLRCKPK